MSDPELPRVPRKFLKKGEGTSRFQGVRPRRNSNNSEPSMENGQQRSSSQLPNFKLRHNSVPTTARTDPDSGKGASPFFGNDDYTRPPTADTISMDAFPVESSNQPMVVEERDIDTSNMEHNIHGNDDEYIEEVSAHRSFDPYVSDSGASMASSAPTTNCTDLSEEQRMFRNDAKRMHQKMFENQAANSINSPGSSDMSAPLGQSTPIHNEMGNFIPRLSLESPDSVPSTTSSLNRHHNRQQNHKHAGSVQSTQSSSQFHHNISTIMESPPPQVPPKSSGAQTGASLLQFRRNQIESTTPVVSRPFASNRVNTNAQTGKSLLEPNDGYWERHKDVRNKNMTNQQNQNQKENLGNIPMNSHVYDQPVLRRKYSEIEWNLICQLRDAIAHLDYAESNLIKMAKTFKEKSEEMEKALREMFEKKRIELIKEYERKHEELVENMRMESDRIAREKADIQRERNALKKDANKKKEEEEKMKEEHRKKITSLEDKLSQSRVEIRNKDEKLKMKEEENEKLRKELDRSRKNCATMESNLRLLRSEKNKEEKKKKTFEEEKNRMGYGMNRRVVPPPPPPVAPQTSIMAHNIQNPNINQIHMEETVPRITGQPNKKTRSVSFADSVESGYNSFDLNKTSPNYGMRVSESGTDGFGSFVVYRDEYNRFTKVTKTIENGTLSQFMNGDSRWMNESQTIILYHYASSAILKVELVKSNIFFLFFANRQMEIIRPRQQDSLVSYNRNEIRTEVIRNGQIAFAEIYDRDGHLVVKDKIGGDRVQRYETGRKTSFRDNETRYVNMTDFNDFEYVEPEFRLRWYCGVSIVCKLFARNTMREKTLRLEIAPKNGEGKLESVQILPDKMMKKNLIFDWNGTHS